MRIKLTYILVGGLIYFLLFKRPKPNMDYLGYGDGNQGIVTNAATEWA